MKKVWMRIGILFAIFVAALVLFSSLQNREVTENSTDMEEPTLPVIYMCYENTILNQLNGYTQQMQVEYMRDCITPLETSRQLTVAVKNYGNKIESMNYEVRTADGNTIVENGKIGGFLEDGEYVKAVFEIQNAILMNQEYSLVLNLQIDGKEVYYYTRLLQRAGLNISKYLEYVQYFYQNCISKQDTNTLNNAIEPDASTTNSSFLDVNIHSSLAQITWGTLNPQVYREAIPKIKEINETTASITMEYMISAQNSVGETELYYVTEFYRMRYYQSSVMLLDFERSAKQIMNGELSVMSTTGIILGITEADVDYASNTNGDILAFVQQGELWCYNQNSNKIESVYSFRNINVDDARNDYLGHDIKIVRVDDNGDIDFIVYGYMNKDKHEGQAGVGVYHYSSQQNNIEEKIFIPMTKSFEFLNSDIDILSYINTQNLLYLYLQGSIYEVDCTARTYQVIKEQIDLDCFVVSSSQGKIAWMDEMQEYGSSNVTIMDLETKETRQVSAGDGEKIRALGFMNDDFVYGLARDEYIMRDSAGNVTFAMHTVRIQDFDGNIVKEYAMENIWVNGIHLSEGLLELNRITVQDGIWTGIASDHIMNNQQKNEDKVKIKTTVLEQKGTIVSLILSTPIQDKNPLVLYARMQMTNQDVTMSIELQEDSEDKFYVYAYGELESIWTKVNEAIVRADSTQGVVLNQYQQYIWERGNKLTKTMLTLGDVPESMLSGNIDENQLQESLGDSAKVMNLTGCTLDEVLYEVSQQRAVVVKISDVETRVIVGYDQYNTWLYDPQTQSTYAVGMTDSEAMFAAVGNVFVTYIENVSSMAASQG